jgi:hypothetical protein
MIELVSFTAICSQRVLPAVCCCVVTSVRHAWSNRTYATMVDGWWVHRKKMCPVQGKPRLAFEASLHETAAHVAMKMTRECLREIAAQKLIQTHSKTSSHALICMHKRINVLRLFSL